MGATTRRGASSMPSPPGHRSAPTGRIRESWRAQPWSMRVLRAFLGVTFLYAGLQKLADPNFLHAGSLDYIGHQLRSFEQGSPIAPILRMLDHAPVLVGVGIALTEAAIGLGTLAGVAPTLAAAGGFLVNLSLTLSATWHVHPYFLGSDSMYAVGWLAYLVGLLEIERRRRAAVAVGRKNRPAPPGQITRRQLLRGGALAGGTLAAAALATAIAGPASPATRRALGTTGTTEGGGGATGTTGARGTTGSTGSTGTSASGSGTPIASLDQLSVGDAVGFDAPGVGPAALIRIGQNQVVAYSRTCTHAGCLVGYDRSAELLYCPCHGAEFDPTDGARVVGGPAPSPLPPVEVAIDRATGEVILPS